MKIIFENIKHFEKVPLFGMITFMLFMMHSAASIAQTAFAAEYQVKAVFLYNFTRFIDWPEDSFDSPYAPFVIGVIGDDGFMPYVEAAVEGERLGTHLIRLERYNNVRDIGNCHILFVALQDPDDIKAILKAVAGKRVLTVGDAPNFARWGGMIRFYKEQSRIRLQINNTAARANGIRISSKLLNVAQVF